MSWNNKEENNMVLCSNNVPCVCRVLTKHTIFSFKYACTIMRYFHERHNLNA